MDVGLEPGFIGHAISLALTWVRVLMAITAGRQRISWVGFWLKARFIGAAAGALVVRTLKDQWFALALGAAALTALFWLELIAY